MVNNVSQNIFCLSSKMFHSPFQHVSLIKGPLVFFLCFVLLGCCLAKVYIPFIQTNFFVVLYILCILIIKIYNEPKITIYEKDETATQ